MSYFDEPEHLEAWLLELDELKALKEQNKHLIEAQNDVPHHENMEYYETDEEMELIREAPRKTAKNTSTNDWKPRSKGIYDQADHIPHDDEYYFNVKNRERIEDILYDDGLDLVGGYDSVLDIPINPEMLKTDDLAIFINSDGGKSNEEYPVEFSGGSFNAEDFDFEKAANSLTNEDIESMGTLADPELLLEDSDLEEDYEDDFIRNIDIKSILLDDEEE